MNLVNRLIWRELIGPLVNSFFMFTILVFATAHLFTLTDYLVRGVPVAMVARLAILSLPMLITQTLPMSMLLACLLGFGRLSGDSEHIALYAGGISFYRIMWPVAWLGLAVSILSFVWNETIVPPSTREFMRLKQEAVEGLVTTGHPLKYFVTEGERVDEVVVVDGGYDSHSHGFLRVSILKMSNDPKRVGQPDLVVYAEQAIPQGDDPTGLDWKYKGCYLKDVRPDKDKKYIIDVFLGDVGPEALQKFGNVGMRQSFKGVLRSEKPDNRSMTFRELRDKIRDERAQGKYKEALEDEVDLWGKLSTPLASLIFGIVGAPFGVRPHRGSKAMGFGIAIGIIFLYWVTYQWMFVVGKSGALPPMLAAFTPDIIGIAAAIVLMARTRQ